MRRLALLAALLPFAALADEVDASALTPWTYTDGSPLAPMSYLWRSGCVKSGQYERPIEISADASHTFKGIPDAVCYFRVSVADVKGEQSALSDNEGAWDGVANRVLPPTPTQPPRGTPSFAIVIAPPPAPVTVTMRLDRPANADQPHVVVTGSGLVTLTLPAGQVFDWLKIGAQPTGVGGTVVPTAPPLGANNNDGQAANSITVTAPIDAYADTDLASSPTAPNAFTGASATVNGVTKLVPSGSTVSF